MLKLAWHFKFMLILHQIYKTHSIKLSQQHHECDNGFVKYILFDHINPLV